MTVYLLHTHPVVTYIFHTAHIYFAGTAYLSRTPLRSDFFVDMFTEEVWV